MLKGIRAPMQGIENIPENGLDAEKELEFQKNMLLKEYVLNAGDRR